MSRQLKNQAVAIQKFLLAKVKKHPSDIVAIAMAHFKVTRTTIHRHLNTLVSQNLIIKSGTTKNINYYLYDAINKTIRLPLTTQLDEFSVWLDFKPHFEKISKNAYSTCEYGFTEILNNAKDHSGGTWVNVSTQWDATNVTIIIQDNGIGLFSKIKNYFHLENSRESILEITKGKVTTDPISHSGEGIFFSLRAFDLFEIEANRIKFSRDNVENDWFTENSSTVKKGTLVRMQIAKNSKSSLINLFKTYQDDDSLAFDKTDIIVALWQQGSERYISRSQAKRILRGLDKFSTITFDFNNITAVGQGFVDEIFRVFQQQHPNITLQYIHANEEVLFMLQRSIPMRARHS